MPGKSESEGLASYWQQQIEAWQSSGQTQQAYCKANELSYHRFGYWPCDELMSLTGQQINWLLDGYDISQVQGHKKLHYDALF